MITPPCFPVLAGQGWSVHKRPTFSTRVASHVSGREVRRSLYAGTLYEYEVTFDGLALERRSSARWQASARASLQTLLGFYLTCQGQFGTFLYTDPSDNTVKGQAIATGDGATTAFTMVRSIGGFTEPVSWVTAISNVYRRRRGAVRLLRDHAAQHRHFAVGAGGGCGDHRRLHLRLRLPLPRRPGGFREHHAWAMADAEPQVSKRADIMTDGRSNFR